MIALLFFALAILASPFKSKRRLEAENAALRQQLVYERLVTARLAGDGISRLRPRRILGFEFRAK